MQRRVRTLALTALAGLAGLGLSAGCPPPPDDGDNTGIYNNTTDPTNAGATYVGSPACAACHPDYADRSARHGHVHAVQAVAGQAPAYPDGAPGVPEPPAGRTWNDVSYIIGGYWHGAFFIDQDGYIMTNGTEGVDTLYQVPFAPSQTPADFVPFLPGQAAPLAWPFDVLAQQTTGASPDGSQGGRPGIEGTFVQAGVQCEACHGPGSNHVPNPQARDLFVDSTVQTCARCHTGSADPAVIAAENGYLLPNTQYAELRASGGHRNFSCGICHDPHASTVFEPDVGVRNACTACHGDANLALHSGVVYQLGDYTEPVTCVSCHMPFTGLATAAAMPAAVGAAGRMGDVRGHIFRIDPTLAEYTEMFTDGGTQVAVDAEGLAGVSIDFVCLRCHNGQGNAFTLPTLTAQEIATQIHESDDILGP